MLKSKVSHSINPDDFQMGVECGEKIAKELSDVKVSFLYTSVESNINKVIEGVNSKLNAPLIGCTSSGGVIVPEGIITSEKNFAGMLSLNDPDMVVGVAAHEAGKDPRLVGRKVAIKAVENAKTTRAPSYFYMVATPGVEEEYLMGIEDVIGRVPMFGGSAADDNFEGKWKIICNNEVISDGVAVAFFYTDNEIVTSFTGAYKETNNMGLITKVKGDRILEEIDRVSALKKYAHWTNIAPSNLKGSNLLLSSITKPLGIKDPLGTLTVIRHPMFGNDMGTKTMNDDTITLGNKIIEGTAIIQLEASKNDLINACGETLKDLRRKVYYHPAAYLLMHSAGRMLGIGNRIGEVHKQLLKETKGVPFIAPFVYGEYGYEEHSSNICGGLMLSFTVFSRK